MIIERVKKFFEFQRRSVHGPVPLWGVLNGIFILYPLVFTGFWLAGLRILKNPALHQGLIIVGTCLVNLDSEEILSEKAIKNVYNFLFGPPVILSLCFIFLGMIGYDYFMGWGMSLLFMIFGPYLYRTWLYIIYAYQHRHYVEETASIKHIKVNPDMISNREFDRDRFKK